MGRRHVTALTTALLICSWACTTRATRIRLAMENVQSDDIEGAAALCAELSTGSARDYRLTEVLFVPPSADRSAFRIPYFNDGNYSDIEAAEIRERRRKYPRASPLPYGQCLAWRGAAVLRWMGANGAMSVKVFGGTRPRFFDPLTIGGLRLHLAQITTGGNHERGMPKLFFEAITAPSERELCDLAVWLRDEFSASVLQFEIRSDGRFDLCDGPQIHPFHGMLAKGGPGPTIALHCLVVGDELRCIGNGRDGSSLKLKDGGRRIREYVNDALRLW